MFTPATLLELAVHFETIAATATRLDRYDALRNADQALACAAVLEAKGVEEVKAVGPFSTMTLKRGDKVRVKKGAVVHSTHPKFTRDGIALSRSQTITVFDMHKGYIAEDFHHFGLVTKSVVNPRVNWVGESGYWKWVDINDVEIVH